MSVTPTAEDDLLSTLLAAQRAGDHATMRRVADEAGPDVLAAAFDLAVAETTHRMVEQISDADRLAILLARASVYSRLNEQDPRRRHQVAHPWTPLADAVRWELGDRVANVLKLV